MSDLVSSATETVQSIFCRAIELPSAPEQDQFVEAQCNGQPALQNRIMALLMAHRSSRNFLRGANENAGNDAGTNEAWMTLQAGSQIDRYRILDLIGEGGFGVVFRAEQLAPIRRQVALKLIKPGMDTRQVIARFEHERQALAMMDHPNIARVLDAGTTDSGRPYFVMELVQGEPITAYCDSRQVPIARRLELFEIICEAVQHAHQKGIVHRDLKPSNILVLSNEQGPVVKIIDFGIAKAITGSTVTLTSLTQGAAWIGTPVYMSPEQAGFKGLDIDTRSDIYSLGAVLYELLVAVTPLEKSQMETMTGDELRRWICEVDPLRPSQRIAASPLSAEQSMQRCGLDSKKLAALLRGELDWIVMKSLEKDRARRYASAGSMAADIRRYLNHESVVACPPSAGYRLRKFARRNRVAISTAAILIFALAGAAIISTRAALIAQNAETQTHALLLAEQEAHDEARRAQTEAGREKVRAETNLAEARAAIDQMLNLVINKTDLGYQLPDKVRHELLRNALQFYERFLERNASDPELQVETARTSSLVGEAHGSLGEIDASVQAFRRAIQLYDALATEFPNRADIVLEMSQTKLHLSGILRSYPAWWAASELLLVESVATLEDWHAKLPADVKIAAALGEAQHDLGYVRAFVVGNQQSAELPLRRSLELQQQLVEQFPDDQSAKINLVRQNNSFGIFLRQNQRAAEASEIHLRSLEWLDELNAKLGPAVDSDQFRSERARSLLHRAYALESLGQLEQSERTAREAIAIRQVFQNSSPNADAELALTRFQLASVLERQERWDLAEDEYRTVVEMLRSLLRDSPQNAMFRFHFLFVLRKWGNLAAQRGQTDSARTRFQELAATDPDSPSAKTVMAWQLANCPLVELRDPARAVELAEVACQQTPTDGRCWAALGAALYRRGSWDQAISPLEKASELLRPSGNNIAAYFLVMARWQLSDKTSALNLWKMIDATDDPARSDAADLRTVRAEAATLLGLSDF